MGEVVDLQNTGGPSFRIQTSLLGPLTGDVSSDFYLSFSSVTVISCVAV